MPTLRRTVFNPEGELQADGLDQIGEQRAARALATDQFGRDLDFRRMALAEQGRQFDVGGQRQFDLARLGEEGATRRTEIGVSPQMRGLDMEAEERAEGKPLRSAEQAAKLREIQRNNQLDDRIYQMLDIDGSPTPMQAFQSNTLADAQAGAQMAPGSAPMPPGPSAGLLQSLRDDGQDVGPAQPAPSGGRPPVDYKALAALSAIRSGQPLGAGFFTDPEKEDQRMLRQLVLTKAVENLQSPNPQIRQQAQSALAAAGVEAPQTGMGAGSPQIAAEFVARPGVQAQINQIVSKGRKAQGGFNTEESVAELRQLVDSLVQTAVAEGASEADARALILEALSAGLPKANVLSNPISSIPRWLGADLSSRGAVRSGLGLE